MLSKEDFCKYMYNIKEADTKTEEYLTKFSEYDSKENFPKELDPTEFIDILCSNTMIDTLTELMEDTNHLIWEYIESWDYGEKLNIYADKKYEALYHMTFDGLYDAIVAGNLPAPEDDTTYADKAPEISREKFIDLMFIAKKTKQDEEEELAELKHDLDPDVYTEVDERLALSYGSHSLIDAIHSLMNVDNNELSLIRTYIEDLKWGEETADHNSSADVKMLSHKTFGQLYDIIVKRKTLSPKAYMLLRKMGDGGFAFNDDNEHKLYE